MLHSGAPLSVRRPMKLKRSAVRLICGGLLCVGAVLVGATIYEMSHLRPVVTVSSPANGDEISSTTRPATEIMERSVAPLSVFSEIVERPLFRGDRRPYVPAGPVDPGPRHASEPDISTQISLSGVLINEGERVALIEHRQNKKLQQLRQGDSVNGWTLGNIQAGSILVDKQGRTSRITLVISPSQPAPKAPQKTSKSPPESTEEATGDSPVQPEPIREKKARTKPAPRQSG